MSMTNEQYHKSDAVSKSHLDVISKSGLHYKAHYIDKVIERVQTPAFIEGSLVHSMVLEPENTVNEFVLTPDINKKTKAGKKEFEAFEEEHKGKQIVTSEMWMKALAMSQSVRVHSEAGRLLSDGVAESSHFWTDKKTGLECKARPDWLRNDGVIVDLKTTLDASPAGFAKSVANFRYHVQDYWYKKGVDADKFVFVCVEKNPPYAVAVYELDPEAVKVGGLLAERDFRQIAEGRENGIWCGFDGIKSLSLPNWAKNVN